MISRFLDTEKYECALEDVELSEGVYIYGNFEERSGHFDPKDQSLSHIEFIEVNETEEGDFVTINGTGEIPYNHIGKLKGFINSLADRKIYIDITGLSHAFWAPLLKLILEQKRNISIIYVEPKEYTKSKNPIGGSYYDLSERIKGIAPLPGFANFYDDEDNFVFVPILGFEGQRYQFVHESIQPFSNKTFPVIGVPGYRPEYPFYSYHGNRLPLIESKAWKNVRFVSASCPYEIFDLLTDLAKDFPQTLIKIALLGTKPHALGAILFRLANPSRTELIYDHPIRRKKRSSGAMVKHIYHVSDFFNSNIHMEKLLSGGRLR